MKIKRRCATLLELLIAMSLTMLIMAALAYFYRQINNINQEAEVQQTKLFKQLYLSTRLNNVLPKIQSPTSKNTYFFTTSAAMQEGAPSLIFSYNNGVQLDPLFSNNVLGWIFVDKQHRLCLAVWPSDDRWEESKLPPIKCEILSDNVSKVEYRFFSPPKRNWERCGSKWIKISNNQKNSY
jgi:hypothetical protein